VLKFMLADDTACVDSDTNLTNLISFVHAELEKVARWFRANHLAVKVDKTKFLIFHSKGKKINHNVCLIYDDNEPRE
jgi:hypothetical protein